MKHLDELKRELASPRPESDVVDGAGRVTSVPTSTAAAAAPTSSYSIRIRAERAAESLLSNSDAKTFLNFISFYTQVIEKCPHLSIEDASMLRAFNLFEGDISRAVAFLPLFLELTELGFGEDEVVSALLLHSNDREAALDHLMK